MNRADVDSGEGRPLGNSPVLLLKRAAFGRLRK
jgi:hypothetical protein